MKTDTTPQIFILMGASNLARGHLALAKCLKAALSPQSCEFFFALGPGRSYRTNSGFLWYFYPPIENCGIIEHVKKNMGNGTRITALVMDIGNDIMCGVNKEALTDCLENQFASLNELGANIFATPISSWLETELGPAEFNFLRTLLYPRSKVTYETMRNSVATVNRYLKGMDSIDLIPGLERYSGWDRIHFSLLKSHFAWSEVAVSLLTKNTKPINLINILASLQNHLSQLIRTDFLKLGPRGPNYF